MRALVAVFIWLVILVVAVGLGVGIHPWESRKITAEVAKRRSDKCIIPIHVLIKEINKEIRYKTCQGKYEIFISMWSKAYNKDIAEHYQNLGFKITYEKGGYIISWDGEKEQC